MGFWKCEDAVRMARERQEPKYHQGPKQRVFPSLSKHDLRSTAPLDTIKRNKTFCVACDRRTYCNNIAYKLHIFYHLQVYSSIKNTYCRIWLCCRKQTSFNNWLQVNWVTRRDEKFLCAKLCTFSGFVQIWTQTQEIV